MGRLIATSGKVGSADHPRSRGPGRENVTMIHWRRSRIMRSARQRALTLIEVLLVLVVLVMTAAFSWPMLTRAFESQRLRSAADLIRSRLTRARIEAIETGQTCRFQYSIDGRSFSIKTESNSEETAGDSELKAALGVVKAERRLSGELPEGITFAPPPDGGTAAPADISDIPGDISSEDVEGASWSPPIYFHPNGTTSRAVIRLRNAHGRALELTLRGETGVVTVGDVFADESL